MSEDTLRQLRVFLSYASEDSDRVTPLYKRLQEEDVDVWFDRETMLPGQVWEHEIDRGMEDADVIILCLSRRSVSKEGYIQSEIAKALSLASQKPEDTIFLIPARLDDVSVPRRLKRWHWVEPLSEEGFEKLLRSRELRALQLGGSATEAVSRQGRGATSARL